jgi:hypothetical protein
MSIRARRVWSLLALCLLAGCASVDGYRIGTAARPRVPADSVRLFFSPDYVSARYEPVAVLGTDLDWNRSFNKGTYDALRARAGQLGANAVILGSVVGADGRPRIAGLPPRALTSSVGRAVAVYIFNR